MEGLRQLPARQDLPAPRGLERLKFAQWGDAREDGSLRIVIQQYRLGMVAGKMAANGFREVPEWRDRDLAKPLGDYMGYSERRKRSHNNDRAKANHFRALFRNRLALDITTREIEDFLAAFRNGRAAATVNHYAKFLKAVFNRAIRHGRIAKNPMMPIRLDRENKRAIGA